MDPWFRTSKNWLLRGKALKLSCQWLEGLKWEKNSQEPTCTRSIIARRCVFFQGSGKTVWNWWRSYEGRCCCNLYFSSVRTAKQAKLPARRDRSRNATSSLKGLIISSYLSTWKGKKCTLGCGSRHDMFRDNLQALLTWNKGKSVKWKNVTLICRNLTKHFTLLEPQNGPFNVSLLNRNLPMEYIFAFTVLKCLVGAVQSSNLHAMKEGNETKKKNLGEKIEISKWLQFFTVTGIGY